jgi:two-component system LytT family sensor kinase
MLKLFDDGAGGRGRQRLMRLAFIWGVWTLVGLFFSSQVYVYFARTEKPVSVAWAIAWQMPAVYLFALSTPLVLWFARRYRIERANWRRRILIHLLAGTVISAVWAACHIVLDVYFRGHSNNFEVANMPRLMFANLLDKELLVYWIIVLSSHAVDYYQRYREGELRASQAQLQALKMQLQPHFLFNALHSISALVHKDPEAADRMIARLGDFLRLTLDTAAAQEVTLRQELEFLNCYLEIERIRFQDRLTTRLDVDPKALDCRVPNLLLQPVVENAIRHGVAPRSTPGRVEIRAERRGPVLRLQVRDNGAGLPTGDGASRVPKGGVGLSNTRARLAQLYGAAYRFELENDPSGGAIVTIEIPSRGVDAETDGLTRLGLDEAPRAAHPSGRTRAGKDSPVLPSRA